MGQVYVLVFKGNSHTHSDLLGRSENDITTQGDLIVPSKVSRVTDPKNFLLCGLPPKDMWEDVAEAWLRAGLNVPDCWKRACSVTNEWVYDDQPTKPLKSRITQRLISERGIPLKNRTLPDVLNPQPDASVVFKRLLESGRTIIPVQSGEKCDGSFSP